MNSDLDVRSNIKKRIADACRILGVLDITLGTLGHASARIPGSESFLIRGRGPAESGVRYTSSEDIITIDQNGQRVDGSDDGYLPPLEVHIHTELYRERPDINAVVHVHPQNPVLLSICNAAPLPIYGAYDPHSLDLVLSGIPIYTKSILVRTPELGQELATCMGDAEVCIMKGHGVTTAANSVEEAALHAIHLDRIAKMTVQAKLLGDVTTIPAEDEEEFRALKAETSYGAPKFGKPSGRAANLWRYYVRLADERR